MDFGRTGHMIGVVTPFVCVGTGLTDRGCHHDQ